MKKNMRLCEQDFTMYMYTIERGKITKTNDTSIKHIVYSTSTKYYNNIYFQAKLNCLKGKYDVSQNITYFS